MKTKLILLLLLFSPLLYSCESIFGDDEPELPPITTTGEDTFGCKIDGKVYLPYFESFMTNQSLFASEYYRQIDITAWNEKWVKRNDDCSHSTLVVLLKRDSNDIINNQGWIIFTECNVNYPDGEIEFRAEIFQNQGGDNSFEILKDEKIIDTDKITFSGKFNAEVVSNDGQKRKITNGRFDVKMRKQP